MTCHSTNIDVKNVMRASKCLEASPTPSLCAVPNATNPQKNSCRVSLWAVGEARLILRVPRRGAEEALAADEALVDVPVRVAGSLLP